MPPQTPFFSSNKYNISPTDLDFWEDVEHYRKEGIQSLVDKKEKYFKEYTNE